MVRRVDECERLAADKARVMTEIRELESERVRLEKIPTTNIERVRAQLAEIDSKLAGKRERLSQLERRYNARCT